MLDKIKDIWSKKWVRRTTIIAGAVIVVIIAAVIVLANLFSGMKHTELDQNDLGISIDYSKEDDEKISGIVNIALFGIDTTDGAATIGDQYRSDCIMILSLDPMDNNFKVISILRDTKVPIEGHDPQKINAAYKYGGAQLAVKTVNQNFKTNIKDYVTVDFSQMAEIVDILGGLEIEVTEAEAKNMALNLPAKPVEPGLRLLDGEQTVTYSRVRKVDSDYYRASRQQNVLDLIFEKIKSMPKDKYPALIQSFMKCVETSMSYSDIMKIVRSFDMSTAEIIKNTVPDPEYEINLRGGLDNTGSWVWTYDLDAAANRIHQIIYGRDLPGTEKETTKQNTTRPTYGGNNGNTYVPAGANTQNVNNAIQTTAQPETERADEVQTVIEEIIIEEDVPVNDETTEDGAQEESGQADEDVISDTPQDDEPVTTFEPVTEPVTAAPESATEPVTAAPEPVTEPEPVPEEPQTEAEMPDMADADAAG